MPRPCPWGWRCEKACPEGRGQHTDLSVRTSGGHSGGWEENDSEGGDSKIAKGIPSSPECELENSGLAGLPLLWSQECGSPGSSSWVSFKRISLTTFHQEVHPSFHQSPGPFFPTVINCSSLPPKGVHPGLKSVSHTRLDVGRAPWTPQQLKTSLLAFQPRLLRPVWASEPGVQRGLGSRSFWL